jgi:hypothetical protein
LLPRRYAILLKHQSKEQDMSITEIEQAIMELPPEELARFREWFEEYCAEVWDKQIEIDAKSDRFDKLVT